MLLASSTALPIPNVENQMSFCIRLIFSILDQIARQAVLAALITGPLFLKEASANELLKEAGGNQTWATGPVNDRRDDSSPWVVASGAEWFSAFPTFNPVLKEAGVHWLRGFYEWQTMQPKQGYWNFALQDRLVENTRANNIHLVGTFAYFAPWASANGGTRRFPIRDINFWREYVTGMVERYHADIKYWEVWNEFNGSFAENGTPEIYAELVLEASVAAKKVDPTAEIGMSVANFDIGFLDAAIKAGAANHFDYICVHPYEKLDALSYGGEPAFLSMAGTLRQMLASNRQSVDMPLWITEIGSQAPVTPNHQEDQVQANLLIKAYLLSIASGFQRVFWFEARGPSYGKQTDFGLIRADMTPRPSYEALKAITAILGPSPRAVGWLNMGDGGYGFLFDAQGKYVLAAWTPKKRNIDITFAGDVRFTDLSSGLRPLQAGKMLHLTDVPKLIVDIPTTLVEEARLNKPKPYPWGRDYASLDEVTARLEATNTEKGITQINPETTVTESAWRRTDIARPDGEGHYIYFQVDPQFLPYGAKRILITATVRRLSTDKAAGFSINYESQKGYVNTSYSTIPEDGSWHEISWNLNDANFVGAWGWNFRLNAISSPSDFLIKEVRVKKLQSP
jgi:polysaccharide biosynthesis protein PslG